MMRKPKVLFFSTGGAERSQMAEGFLRKITGDQIEGKCTAVRAEADPLAAEVMQEVGVDVTQNHPDEIKDLFQEQFACVITLSDDSKERSPVWPFTRNIYHWNLEDPAASDAPAEEQRRVFRRVRDEILHNVRDFAATVAPVLQSRAAGSGR